MKCFSQSWYVYPVQTFQNLIIGDGGLPVFGVYHLPWAVKWIQAKR